MKKFIYSFSVILISLIILFIFYLSTIGIETSKFNNLVVSAIKKEDPNIKISLDKIKIKFDAKKIQIYLATIEPQIIYHDIKIPIKEINLYSKLISILKSKNEINQAIFNLENFKVKDFQKIATRIKPSNFKTYLLNNLNDGQIEKILIDIKLGKNLSIKDYKVNGSVKKINIKLLNDLLIQDMSFNFISDKNLTLINSLDANYQDVLISDGYLSLKRNKQIDIEGKFNSKFNLNKNQITKLFDREDIKFLKKNQVKAQGSLLHNFTLKIDENFKLINYDYKSNGKILESQITLKDNFKSSFLEKPIKNFSIINTNVSINFNKKKDNLLIIDGLYNLGGSENKKFKISHDLNKKKT